MYAIFGNFEKKYVNYVNYESIKLKYVIFEIDFSANVKSVYFNKTINNLIMVFFGSASVNK